MAHHIAHISSAHPANDTRVFYRECVSLKKAGFDVTLIALADQDKVVDGVSIKAVRPPKNRLLRLLLNVPTVLIKSLQVNAQLYHYHDPELTPVGLVLRLLGKKVIFDVHEDFPAEAYGKFYLPRWAQTLASKVLGGIFWAANWGMSGIVVVHTGIANKFTNKNTILVENFPELPNNAKIENRNDPANQYDAVYTGALNEIRCPYEMIDALADEQAHPKTRLQFAGKISPASLEDGLKKRDGWSKVVRHEWMTPDELSDLMANAKLGLVLYKPLPNHINAQPRKLFEYMAAGLPIVGSDFPRWRELIIDTGCGLVVDPENPTEIAKAMRWIFDNPEEAEEMGRRGLEAAQTRFNWDSEAERLIKLYRKLLD